jgi:hypothetical protein
MRTSSHAVLYSGVQDKGRVGLRHSHPEARSASQTWGLVAFKVRIVSFEEKALEALGLPKDVVWDAFPFRANVFDQSVHCLYDGAVDECVAVCDLDVSPDGFGESSELLRGVPALIGERILEVCPSRRYLICQAVLSRRIHWLSTS